MYSGAIARIPRAVQRDMATICARWSEYFTLLSSEAFALLFILHALRAHGIDGRPMDRLHFAQLATRLRVSPNTLRRWLRTLRHCGVLTTRFVPGTHSTQAYFEIHLPPMRDAVARVGRASRPPARTRRGAGRAQANRRSARPRQ